ncbi:MAG: diacylglycerol kinase family lipid kinase [Actinomycetota bacterium]|nr:diacylglycerol kinase family lipid kinase [Actinomycetota bacterium]
MNKAILILNPSASQGKTILEKEKIEAELRKSDIDYQMHISKSAQDIEQTTKKYIDLGYKNFIGVGGDGTLHYMAQYLAGTDCNLGIISTGSGNDIIKTLEIKQKLEENIKIIKQGKTRRIDLGLYNNKQYYIGIAGCGFDSEVTRYANETKLPLKGKLRYSFSVYKTLITYRPKIFKLRYDEVKRNINIMMMVVSNLKYYGGGMKITPNADAFDSQLDVCIIKAMPKMTLIKFFPKVYNGTHLDIPYVETFKISEIDISCDYSLNVYGDGEYLGKLPANFKIMPGMLNLFVP